MELQDQLEIELLVFSLFFLDSLVGLFKEGRLIKTEPCVVCQVCDSDKQEASC
jgi:hypothetical protein